MDHYKNTRTINKRFLRAVGGVIWCAVIGGVLLWSRPAMAQTVPPLPQPPPDAACKLCHRDSTATVTLPSGDIIHAGIDPAVLDQSVHGVGAAAPVYCTDCHAPRQRYQFPHGENPAQDLAQFHREVAQNCEQCHVSAEVHNPGHLQAEDASQLPNCVDCHGGHAAAPVAAMQADPVGACQQCHQEFADPHVGDVHAELAANLGAGQTCETCHASTPQSEDAKCQTCHSLLTSQLTLASGDTVELHVNPQDIVDSVHGEQVIDGVQYTTLRCTDCHQDQALSGFPHQPIDAETRRELTISMQRVCQDCHTEIFELNADGVHAQHIADGDLEAATCADCHGNHAIHDPDEPRERVSQTCGNCHSEINEQYEASVHGAALLGENNPDVPVCTDCHGVHNIPDPTTAAFRLSSPQMCGRCHADVDMMEKYNISTEVFDTYVADFHGTTVTLFERHGSNEETNKAVCYDCHGVHNILPATDENSQVIKANLLATCRQCHPDANENFPDSWTSHFKPSLEHNPLVYFVDLFYMIVIPATIGGFVLFIGTDILRRTRERFQRKRRGSKGE
ncbi:cytochrome c3 family protein [Caldilinea sp.]|uniref:cytochrome c3 family protein n=1 Tax=Caldilinea sp. TaxID=2293560 RepID=UPI002BB91B27|nr:cytochrome c3 family protein [Anaerolineales bacterium]HQY91020.1 cytochrome c3 family protein [Caldilinea sp.]